MKVASESHIHVSFGNVEVCRLAFYSIHNREVRRVESPRPLSNCLSIFPLFSVIFCPVVLDVFHKKSHDVVKNCLTLDETGS